MEHTQSINGEDAQPRTGSPAARVDAIDLVRGVVMVLMALDHTRDFFTDVTSNPLDLKQTTPALFLTRWVTHFCAPVFVFLAGTGAYLYGSRGRSRAQLSRFLLTRGLWLVVLEFTLVHLGWAFSLEYELVVAQVIWAIGCSMIILSVLVFLPAWGVALVGVAVVGGHNALELLLGREQLRSQIPVISQLRPGLLVGPPPGQGTGLRVVQGYPVIPWLGIMALGFGFGAFWVAAGSRRRIWTAALGTAAILAFLTLRYASIYGDPSPWKKQPEDWATALSFIDCTKYPPSLLYVLMTLGPALVALACFDRPAGFIGRIFVTFGRVPLFYYLLHVPLIHLLAVAFAYQNYGNVDFLFSHVLTGRQKFPAGYGYGLPLVYLMTAVVVACLYPLCRWFGAVKRRHPDGWLSYF